MQERKITEESDTASPDRESETAAPPRIIIGGAPFGPKHLGNEATLESVVHIVREISPESELFACTAATRETEKRLSIKTLPPLGFSNSTGSAVATIEVLKDFDAFIWIGSTGGLTAPEIPLNLLATAKQCNIPTFVFCADLTPQLHLTYYPKQSIAQQRLFSTVRFLSAGIMDLNKDRQTKRSAFIRERLDEAIRNTSFIATRDSLNKIELENLHSPSPIVHLGADPALALTCPDLDTSRFPKLTKDFIEQPGIKVGICFENANENRWITKMIPLLNSLEENRQARFVGISMQTDSHCSAIRQIQQNLSNPDSLHILPSGYDPDEVMAGVSRLDLVLSDQRDLLVLASITLTPFLGIGGGQTVSSFTDHFGLPDFSEPEKITSGTLCDEIESLLNDREAFRKKAKMVRIELLKQLKEVKEQLKAAIQETLTKTNNT